jgi:hypothetical protein
VQWQSGLSCVPEGERVLLDQFGRGLRYAVHLEAAQHHGDGGSLWIMA